MSIKQNSVLLFHRTICRHKLRESEIGLLAKTTIYEMECRREFPPRLNLTPQGVVWDLTEMKE
ncbi:TPA: AlpA family phage regulatory protein [Raoultella planticola]|uniref:AlpA family phage regulatory protein n=1 Tax=Raoultella planticola TaxID=575 RepID=UPI001C5307CF|nr:AlpA family phage regulatory protein [Citrobacter freundii]HDV8889845.1 AlpA family phage regulatory protein [Raoultella planticola]HDV9489235.1 AlpA family phage regulatory protein [Citrobacter freundii]HEC2626333.1 AlpA family phage regulatory protein [Raoultella planticola]